MEENSLIDRKCGLWNVWVWVWVYWGHTIKIGILIMGYKPINIYIYKGEP